ncbi:type 1 glutamine amidotransferase domain-containing protein [Pseudanabaena sp. UWO311]|uniref:type 1 glutamine amidotransferase domain-containing protein n=1 Tax=Pseudanabaena sp. UWO311 TaxID=2487337 RepID=UPI001157789E|nr:type 1 glutamine amidotransferase domain-containing protein [Pseudanabaena sp. UWO311]TYQ28233.1 type 1 glutamine amidotransferase domain-containing protein [Pseudanabaena sp. UWO311]
MSKQILLIVANPSTSTTLGIPVGFWAAELIHPYDAFIKAGCQVTIASPKGGKVEFDSLSDPRDASGYSKDDVLSLQYINQPDFMQLLEKTPAIDDLDMPNFDAIVVCGGQSPMFTFRQDQSLVQLFTNFYETGKPTAALCHGTCLLLEIKLSHGEYLIQGKSITGFANSEEDYADQVVGQKVMPFRIEDEAKQLGANFVTEAPFSPHALRDGNLITGQQQNSGLETAKLVLEALGITL